MRAPVRQTGKARKQNLLLLCIRGNRQLLQAFLAEIIPNPTFRVYPVSLLGV